MPQRSCKPNHSANQCRTSNDHGHLRAQFNIPRRLNSTMIATLATLPVDIILSISAFLSNPLDVLSLSQVCHTTHIFSVGHQRLNSLSYTLRPAAPRSLHLKRGHHTGPNQCQQHTCRVQRPGIATYQANSARLIFDMQPLTVGGSPHHQRLKLHSVCHPLKPHVATWTIPNVGARFEGHAGRGLFMNQREGSASATS